VNPCQGLESACSQAIRFHEVPLPVRYSVYTAAVAVRNAIPSHWLVTMKASAPVKSARYLLNVKSCEELSSKSDTWKCEYYLGMQENHRLIRQRQISRIDP
jgi:hypothetical protein